MRELARGLAACAMLAATAACGVVGGDKAPRSASKPVASKPVRTASLPPARFGTASPRAELWRLRSGLNVAALTCRGRGMANVSGSYAKLLKRHDGLLNQSYHQQVRQHGVNGFDRQQTKVYNRFSMQRSPQKFCGVAAEVAREASSMAPEQLSPASPQLVARLESALR